MNKNTPKQPQTQTAQQLSLFQDSIGKHWEEIRRVEIAGEMHYSILDIFKFYGDTQNYQREWTQVKNTLEKQGFSSDTESVQLHQFEGERQRPTPIGTLEVFLRIAQVTSFKHWEEIRRFMSQAGAEKLESKRQKKQRETIEYMEREGKGDVSGVVLLKAQYELNRGWDVLRAEIFAKCDDPRMGLIVDKEYMAVFGMVSKELRKELNTKSIRDKLGLRQIQALTLAEGMLSDILARQDHVTNEQIYDAIQLAIVPIGRYLRGVSDAMGIHHLTGQPLLKGKN